MADDTTPRNPNDRPSERNWVVPTTTVNEHGEEVPALESAQYALNEAAVVLMRLGGVISIAAKRVKLTPQGRFGERYETEMLVLRWQSFVPAVPAARPPEPEIAVSGATEEDGAA